jgi:hypothetical protein
MKINTLKELIEIEFNRIFGADEYLKKRVFELIDLYEKDKKKTISKVKNKK